jgi:hypothetical protein
MFYTTICTALDRLNLPRSLILEYLNLDANLNSFKMLGFSSQFDYPSYKCHACCERSSYTYFDYFLQRRVTSCNCDRFMYCIKGKNEYQICKIEYTCLFCDRESCAHEKMHIQLTGKYDNSLNICTSCKNVIKRASLLKIS